MYRRWLLPCAPLIGSYCATLIGGMATPPPMRSRRGGCWGLSTALAAAVAVAAWAKWAPC